MNKEVVTRNGREERETQNPACTSSQLPFKEVTMSICDIQAANVIDALTPVTSSHTCRRLVKAWLTLTVST